MSDTAPPGRGLGLGRAVVALARLKWHLLRGGLRGSTQQRVQTVLAAVLSGVFGTIFMPALASMGNESANAGQIIVVLLPAAVLGLGILSAAAGVESTLDPRHLAAEPLTRNELGIGLLVAAVVGPASILAALAGVGILVGWTGGGPTGALVAAAVVVAWWATLLLFSRTAANLLGAVASGRFRQAAQAAAAGAALLAWVATQLLARYTTGWNAERWRSLAGVAQWTPPGQLGRALGALDRPGVALLHLLVGVSWLPLLAWCYLATTTRLTMSSPRPGSGPVRSAARPVGLRDGARRLVPAGRAGAVAARTLATKVRTPRQAVNTLTALVIGAGVFLIGPLFDGGTPDPRIVLVGGLLHFAVLFDGNNAFGMDGPALWIEVSSGADAGVLVRGKVVSSVLVMAVPAVVLPLGLAALSGGWQWVPAAWLIASGSVMAAAGVSVASASLAPVALPDSPNPLASGDTGQGCVAGLMLAAGMLVLIVVSAPVGVAVALGSSRSVAIGTAAAALAPVAGALALWGTAAIARGRLRGREAELVQLVTPAR